MKVNAVTHSLLSYPFDELARWKRELHTRKARVFDFGAGDPILPTWPPIRAALVAAVPESSRYPGIRGLEILEEAQRGYLERRFGIAPSPHLGIIPSFGAREAIFHIALCLVGRAGKRRILCPDPGYPVYRVSAEFAGGEALSVPLDERNGYLLEPWRLPEAVAREATALWVNYPNNPTGAVAPRAYWERLLEWSKRHDVIVLSDECYIDIYDSSLDEDPHGRANRPMSPLEITPEGVLSFHSLSKRSGLTGYRTGFVAGDTSIIEAFVRARSFFGMASPEFIDHAAAVAWSDDAHVAERRRVFSGRVRDAFPEFHGLQLLDEPPAATFYFWCRVPPAFAGDDALFARALANRGVLAVPSRWLGGGTEGFVRFALVPEESVIREAIPIIREVAAG